MGNVCASKDSLLVASTEDVKQVPSRRGQRTPPVRFSESDEEGLVSESTESEVDPNGTSQHSMPKHLLNSTTDEFQSVEQNNTSTKDALKLDSDRKERKNEQPPTLVVESKEESKGKHAASVQEEDDNHEDKDDTPFKPYTLQEIRNKINDLAKQVPKTSKAASIDYTCSTQVREWGESIERLTDQYYLLVYCVSNATYKWSGKRSGAEEQNLGYLDRGLETAGNMIIHAVEKDMTNDTMAPRKWKTLSRTVESEGKKTVGNETKYIYEDNLEENYVRQQYVAKKLSRNAPLQRHILLTAFDLTCRCIDDYLEASQQDENVEASQYDYMY